MYLVLKAGKTSLFQRPQWMHEAEAYSTTVTLALALPSDMSSADTDSFLSQPASATPREAVRATAVRSRRVSGRM
jgi:hypothetical protein